MVGWSDSAYGYSPWGGGTTEVFSDAVTYCNCALISPIHSSPSYCTEILEAEARLTHEGRTNLARMATEDFAFRITQFSVGKGGFNVEDPTRITAIQELATHLDYEVFRAQIDDIDYANVFSSTFVGRVSGTQEYNGLLSVCSVLGEIGLWAEVLYAPNNPEEVGRDFLFAIAHFPMVCVTINFDRTFRITVQF